ncbi:hypothetical protein SLUN_00200 [Streptomyces lunaelactis]|uniref:Secreted protein/lipoprotein n=1 Tax=Streptomyces lunaelactis TaxID=1535768 RepID=A0A2R4SVN3_9ACTN|nr:hypothetical protein SLUN_00200 [Streptomyces lunaelactis]
MCAALLLSGCSTDTDPDPGGTTPDTSAGAAASSTEPAADADPQAAAKTAVTAAYLGYWEEKVAAYSRASVKGTRLKTYAVGEALAATERELAALSKQGYVATGKPRTTPKVASVNTSGQVPSATISDCVDVAAWTLVDGASKKPITLPKERLTRYVSRVTAERWEGRWVILKATQENRSC